MAILTTDERLKELTDTTNAEIRKLQSTVDNLKFGIWIVGAVAGALGIWNHLVLSSTDLKETAKQANIVLAGLNEASNAKFNQPDEQGGQWSVVVMGDLQLSFGVRIVDTTTSSDKKKKNIDANNIAGATFKFNPPFEFSPVVTVGILPLHGDPRNPTDMSLLNDKNFGGAIPFVPYANEITPDAFDVNLIRVFGEDSSFKRKIRISYVALGRRMQKK